MNTAWDLQLDREGGDERVEDDNCPHCGAHWDEAHAPDCPWHKEEEDGNDGTEAHS